MESSPSGAGKGGPRKRTKQDFEFDCGEPLGEGSYSTVMMARERSTNREFAVKILSKAHVLKENKAKYVTTERDILNKLNHPLIIKLFYSFQDSSSLYFCLELARNGDLLSYIRKGRITPHAAQFYAAEIIVATEYLHSQNIIHRDVKPENILLDDNMHIKLADFGSAKDLSIPQTSSCQHKGDDKEEATSKNSFVGTAEYVSPELLNERAASFPSDIWAIGCIIYQLHTTKPPFKAANEFLTFQKIIALQYTYPDTFPASTKKLVDGILLLDPAQRLGIAQIKKEEYFNGIKWTEIWLETAPPLNPSTKKDESFLIPLPEINNEPPKFRNFSCNDSIELLTSPPPPLFNIPKKASSTKNQTSSVFTPPVPEMIKPLLTPNEKIIKHADVVHRKWIFLSKKKILVLTSRRLFFVAGGKVEVIPWEGTNGNLCKEGDFNLTVKAFDEKKFTVLSSGKKWVIEGADVKGWVEGVEATIKELRGKK